MTWQMIALIAIVVTVLLSIPIIILTMKVFKRVFGVFDDIRHDMHNDDFGGRDLADMEERVRRMTGPGKSPFGRDHRG